MRIVGEVPHPQCKITIFSWNSKYLIKVEQGLLEQTYKVSEMDLSGDAAIRKLAADEVFLTDALKRFDEMSATLRSALEKA